MADVKSRIVFFMNNVSLFQVQDKLELLLETLVYE